jgi:integral membrane protein (TIGR00529 family)
MELSPLLKILFVFAGILVLNRLRLHLGAALTLGGLAVGLWAGRGLHQTGGDLLHAFSLAELWLILLMMALIYEFGRYLAQENNAATILQTARAWGGRHGRALGLMAVPSTIGLIPMPGGALFSAPLVQQIAGPDPWPAAWKATVNYWFRHTWEYWWPIFPVVVVTLSIFPLAPWQFVLLQLPLSLATFVGGYRVLIRPHLAHLRNEPAADHPTPPPTRKRLLALPLILVIGCTLLLPTVLQSLIPAWTAQTAKLVAMLLGLALGLVPIFRQSGPDALPTFIRSFAEPKIWSLLATVGGVIVFKEMLERSGLLPLAGERLLESGIPLLMVILLLPFLAGLVTGIAIGFAGIAFPLLAGLVSATDSSLGLASTLVLGFAGGYMGMMLSPIHLCFVLSRNFFGVRIADMYRDLLLCSLFPIATALLLHYGLRGFGL